MIVIIAYFNHEKKKTIFYIDVSDIKSLVKNRLMFQMVNWGKRNKILIHFHENNKKVKHKHKQNEEWPSLKPFE